MAKSVKKSVKKSTKSAKTSKGKVVKKTSKAKSKTAGRKIDTGYKGHREGSRKEQAHKIFDKVKDVAKAKEAVLKLKIKPNTVNSWFSSFRATA